MLMFNIVYSKFNVQTHKVQTETLKCNFFNYIYEKSFNIFLLSFMHAPLKIKLNVVVFISILSKNEKNPALQCRDFNPSKKR